MEKTTGKSKGYDPIVLNAKTERIVVDGNRRKYVRLGGPSVSTGGLPQPQRSRAQSPVASSVSAISQSGIQRTQGASTRLKRYLMDSLLPPGDMVIA